MAKPKSETGESHGHPTNGATPAPHPSEQKVKIAGVIFSAPAPFQAGHILSHDEAGVLNQTLAENLRNNFSRTVETAKEEAVKARGEGAALEQHELDKLALTFAGYAESYKFGVRRVASMAVDPVEREARKIARAAIEAKLRENNVEKPAKERMEELVTQLIGKRPEITAEAKRRVDAVKAAASVSLDDIMGSAA